MLVLSDHFKSSGLIPAQQLGAVASQSIVLTMCLLWGKVTWTCLLLPPLLPTYLANYRLQIQNLFFFSESTLALFDWFWSLYFLCQSWTDGQCSKCPKGWLKWQGRFLENTWPAIWSEEESEEESWRSDSYCVCEHKIPSLRACSAAWR